MKKIVLVLAALALVASGVFAQAKPVFDSKSRAYIPEAGAKIRIGVDNDKWGAAIVDLWNAKYPDKKGMVDFVNTPSTNSADLPTQQQGEAPDVLMVIDGETLRNTQSLMAIDNSMATFAKAVIQEPFLSSTNPGKDMKYVPASYNGLTFAWNKTMMEALKLDTKDSNKDNLPDAFDTWEEIFALSAKWAKGPRPQYDGKPVNIVFPWSVNNTWGVYSALTAGGWQIFAEANPLKPGYEKPTFKAGLEFLKAASDAMTLVEANGAKTPGAAAGWKFDDYLAGALSPFGMVGTWMDVNAAETKGGFDLIFSKMPTWKGKTLAPYVSTKGFIINGFTKYPSAAHELLRLIYTKEGMQAMVDNTSYIPSLKAKAPSTPVYKNDENKVQMGGAFATSHPEPVILLPNNKAKRALDVYYNITLDQIYADVWDGKLSPADAQKKVVDLAGKWIAENNK